MSNWFSGRSSMEANLGGENDFYYNEEHKMWLPKVSPARRRRASRRDRR